MSLNFNSIGNYGSRSINEQPKKVNIRKPEPQTEAKIEKDEKIFFAKLYPDRKNEIMNYSFYERTGKMSGVSVGNNFDKRG